MATKWKNTSKGRRLHKFMVDFFDINPGSSMIKRVRGVLGAALFLAGLVLLLPALLGGYRTVQVWQMGFGANAAFVVMH